MRISDWSSDVCSSDLCRRWATRRCCRKICRSAPGRDRHDSRSGHAQVRSYACFATTSQLLKGVRPHSGSIVKIGRASCRERVCQYVYISVVAVSLKKKKDDNASDFLTKHKHIN